MLKHCREFQDENSLYIFIDDYMYDYDAGQAVYSEEFDNLQPMFLYLIDEESPRYLGLLCTLTIYTDTHPQSGYANIHTYEGFYTSYFIEDTNTYKFAYFHSNSSIKVTFFQEWSKRVINIDAADPALKNISVTIDGVDVTDQYVTIIEKRTYTPSSAEVGMTYYRNTFTVDIPYCTGDTVIRFGDAGSEGGNSTPSESPINNPINNPIINP